MEATAIRLEVFAIKLEAIAIRLEAIASSVSLPLSLSLASGFEWQTASAAARSAVITSSPRRTCQTFGMIGPLPAQFANPPQASDRITLAFQDCSFRSANVSTSFWLSEIPRA